nr:hypothetical protein [bacterium]
MVELILGGMFPIFFFVGMVILIVSAVKKASQVTNHPNGQPPRPGMPTQGRPGTPYPMPRQAPAAPRQQAPATYQMPLSQVSPASQQQAQPAQADGQGQSLSYASPEGEEPHAEGHAIEPQQMDVAATLSSNEEPTLHTDAQAVLQAMVLGEALSRRGGRALNRR